MNNWSLIGCGFISQRHIDAIKDTEGKLVCVCDIDETKKDKVPNVPFFTDYYEMSDSEVFKKVDWVAICTPNYLHYPMIKVMLEKGKKVLCEKPLVIDTISLKSLPDDNLFTVLQLRHNPELQELKKGLDKVKDNFVSGEMSLFLNRGDFYWKGWKGNEHKSGGLLFNIGIHYFDLLLWMLGEPKEFLVERLERDYAEGSLTFSNFFIKWKLSLKAPMDNQIRMLKIGNAHIDLTRHFDNLHTKVYEDILKGKGVRASEAGRTIKLIESMKK